MRLPGYSVWLRAWQVQVGRVKLYLLDSNDAGELPGPPRHHQRALRRRTGLRLKQELVLGIGGWRLLAGLGLQPEVCHLNEGHAAFAVLERARSFMEETGQPFEVALAVTRAGQPLHHPHRRWPPASTASRRPSIEQYLGRYAEQKLGIPLHDLLALGRQDPDDPSETVQHGLPGHPRQRGRSTASAACMARSAAGSSQPLFPRWPEDEVPVGHVTNGVHVPTWDSEGGRRPLDGCLRQGPLAGDVEDLGAGYPRALRRATSGNCAPPPASRSSTTSANAWPATGRRRRAAETVDGCGAICSIPTP